ncbi:MAG: hypothetical protein KDE28_20820 [Anaerolineales bacterium]|nr:hypothetical protein [Anaerolineales bacterium]
MAQHGFADCPDCGADVRLRGKPYVGQIIQCTNCRAALEIEQLNPISLAMAYEEEEDSFSARSGRRPKKKSRRTEFIDN